jgi:hypothetical protein
VAGVCGGCAQQPAKDVDDTVDFNTNSNRRRPKIALRLQLCLSPSSQCYFAQHRAGSVQVKCRVLSLPVIITTCDLLFCLAAAGTLDTDFDAIVVKEGRRSRH